MRSDNLSKPKLEEMSEFFKARVDSYDDHMLLNVVGVEGYIKMAEYIPIDTKTLLDLGCGTGLELEQIFKKFPDMKVTGIDLTKAMLDKLQSKFLHKNLTLIHGNYFEYKFEENFYDVAVTFQTLHHFTLQEKINLYHKIYKTLIPSGIYMEADYMAPNQDYEDFYFAENLRIRQEMGITDGFYHYDTPCTVENQIRMLREAGFRKVEKIWSQDLTVMLKAWK
jgi:ubiquinone/menaquinone biosynthesis C-methylase UbiE